MEHNGRKLHTDLSGATGQDGKTGGFSREDALDGKTGPRKLSQEESAASAQPERAPRSRKEQREQKAAEIRATKKALTRKKVVAKRRVRNSLGWAAAIIAAVAAAFLIRAFVFEIIRVDGMSMYPTLYTNERVATEKVTRYKGMPNRGDIIIVKYPGETPDETYRPGTFVKRVVGLPGETVEVKDSTVYINGAALDEPYTNKEAPYKDMAAIVVPADCVFVMGDNRSNSLDSRSDKIGPIPHDAIVGHGMFVIWPLDSIHSIS